MSEKLEKIKAKCQHISSCVGYSQNSVALGKYADCDCRLASAFLPKHPQKQNKPTHHHTKKTTMKKLSELTQEEKRILCAEECGWEIAFAVGTFADKTFTIDDRIPLCWEPDAPGRKCEHCQTQLGSLIYGRSPAGKFMCIPDYPTSRDAMATAEATLTQEQRRRFICRLVAHHVGDPLFEEHFATASRRLDAFLFAKGLAEI